VSTAGPPLPEEFTPEPPPDALSLLLSEVTAVLLNPESWKPGVIRSALERKARR
jgi:hypothetical protein